MRLLVFEFITGGGFINQPLPASLLQEGHLMRKALLDDLGCIENLEVLVLQDARLDQNDVELKAAWQTIIISQQMDLQALLSGQVEYDAVYLIAPETDGVLAFWCQFFNQQGKKLYTSGQQAVGLCQDKLATSTLLQNAGIACVPTSSYDNLTGYRHGSWVIKVNDSVGCDQVYFLQTQQDWKCVLPRLQADKSYIVQPFIPGKSLSLSCLFYQGQAYFLCCNQQHLVVEQQQFVLSACTVNIANQNRHKYHKLCEQIAKAMPQLFGYAGIDFIETDTGEVLILEINPRLTTSYAGIKAALGINVAELVLNLPIQAPVLNISRNQQVHVSITAENNYAH
ncbi:ATP-grasp domain-containing protein [Methyloprofundus sp.]|uniref:ATP-grasp domain-containing protein n=1 Tax=Methyloprofundus sp. TaxID=2020875 RepID=UPI003D0B5FAA